MNNPLPWFRLYSEFAKDAKVQSMPEEMQRRLIMLFCLECSQELSSLDEDELSCILRIDAETLHETLNLFQKKKFIDSNRNIINWDKRQYKSDNSSERVRKHREKMKKRECNVSVTPPDTDTDTDTELEKEINKEKYFFQGVMFNINHTDKKRWLESYSTFDDKSLKSELQKLDDYYKSKKAKGNLFHRVSSCLAKTNEERIKKGIKPKHNGLTAKDLESAYDC